MAGQRLKDNQWTMSTDALGHYSYEQATLAVLMDLRDEMKRMNSVLNCTNFLAVPGILRVIQEQTKKPKRRRRTLRKVA
jgi:hypothetical protein